MTTDTTERGPPRHLARIPVRPREFARIDPRSRWPPWGSLPSPRGTSLHPLMPAALHHEYPASNTRFSWRVRPWASRDGHFSTRSGPRWPDPPSPCSRVPGSQSSRRWPGACCPRTPRTTSTWRTPPPSCGWRSPEPLDGLIVIDEVQRVEAVPLTALAERGALLQEAT